MRFSNINKYFDLVLESAAADQTEVMVYKESSALTRFSNSEIHQNMAENNSAISIRSITNGKIGTAFTNKVDDKSIKNAVDAAEKNASLSPKDTNFKTLPSSRPITSSAGYVEATARAAPDYRARTVADIIERTDKHNLTAAGSFSTTDTTIGVANSLGSRSIGRATEANLNLVTMGDNSSGYAEFYGKDINDLNIDLLVTKAINKTLQSSNPIKVKPGKYSVILEPAAVADMLGFLAYSGLGALSVQEQRSFMINNFGKRLLSELVSFWDDANDPRTIGLPFDFEAVPKQKVIFFDKGIAKNVVYDSYTANKDGKSSTGHALPAPNSFGPVPMNIAMAAGDSSIDKMIGSTKHGILITRFHYTNLEDPLKTILTGMTRDGTFLIEDGHIVSGIKNLRFTQSILAALNNVDSITKDRQLVKAFIGSCLAPAVKISEFNFTGVSEL